MELEVFLGILGMIFILAGFMLNGRNRHFGSDSEKYNLMNLAGSSLLVYYSYSISSWPFLALNSVWALTALWRINMLFLKKGKKAIS